jgi:gliding motility-associated lipoprotein GldH
MGCTREKPTELYHKFPGNHWDRFNILSFEIPVEKVDKTFDIFLFARFNPEFKYETLDFNMILRSAGEERINEYQMKVKSKGEMFLGKMNNDTSEIVLALKRKFNPGKPGIVIIEIENLTPRLTTEGINGVGIRMVRSGKD